jgi:hypothetical protein
MAVQHIVVATRTRSDGVIRSPQDVIQGSAPGRFHSMS